MACLCHPLHDSVSLGDVIHMCVPAFYHINWINQIILTYLPDFSNPEISKSPTVRAGFLVSDIYPGAVGDAVL